jgi:hypothetical protein
MHKILPFDLILKHLIPFQGLTTSLSNFHFNITLLFTAMSRTLSQNEILYEFTVCTGLILEL